MDLHIYKYYTFIKNNISKTVIRAFPGRNLNPVMIIISFKNSLRTLLY